MTKSNFECLIDFDLQLFAEGAEGASGEGTANAASPVAAAITAQAEKQAKKNPLAGVKYGKQEDAADAQGEAIPDAGNEAKDETAETPEAKAARFEELISGDFRELYEAKVSEKVSSAVKNRLKGVSAKAEQFDQLKGALDLLGAKYNVDPGDVKALARAISGDDELYEKEALEQGVSVERVKAQKLAEVENRRLNAELDAIKRKEAADNLYNRWMREGEDTKKYYPSFDFDREIQNEQFVRLIQNNIDVRSAYEVCHKDELIPAVIHKAEQAEGERLAAKIATNAKRPAENGSSSQSAAIVKNDVTKLTKADREEIARRVARGERIVF